MSGFERPCRTLHFERFVDRERILCTIEECGDGSVYVNSEEFEILYEFCEDAWERAIARVHSCGYTPVQQ